MDFSTIVIIVILLGVLGTIGSVLFWIGVAYLGVKAVQNYQKDMDAMMMNYNSSISGLRNTYGDQIPHQAQQQIFTQYLQAQNRLSHFDNLSQQKHDLFVSDMLGQASSAGIDISNW